MPWLAQYETTGVLLCAGHSYAAAISACATGGEWRRAVQLFDNMLASDIQPDVVSCTALISALAADGQYQHAERALDWMLEVRSYLVNGLTFGLPMKVCSASTCIAGLSHGMHRPLRD